VAYPRNNPAAVNRDSVSINLRSNDSTGKHLLAHALANFDWRPLELMGNIDMKVMYFNQCVQTLLNTYLPVRVITHRVADKPWVTEQFRRLIRCRQHAWTNGNRVQYNRLRNQVNRAARQLRQKYYNGRIQRLRNCDQRSWWRETNRLAGRVARPDLSSLIDKSFDGDTQLFAESFNTTLVQISANLTPLPPDLSNAMPTDAEHHDISVMEVFRRLSSINVYKSPGPDNIPNWFLRDFAFAIAEPICHIFNFSINNGIVPQLWKTANVVPIPKSQPLSTTDDLRPISLTPTLSKVLEAIVGRDLVATMTSKLDTMQFGALKGRSTTHALVAAAHMVNSALDRRQSARMLFVDYSKALTESTIRSF
jgi:hypothetical protein